ncbi:flagellar assembly peptidoglycan hydrolase FlgJ [Methyloterricola oryzae]|uniref:flagellar assembly peptidoglycan hydrolase FlgJ n=1 Tax=Methyloterricola oryzae TaxID=1495050 RepID=UPI0005EB7096|nr:flagellar assembly peptidoglycan hydrolase FlgJ [Methyloterricola oryzae]
MINQSGMADVYTDFQGLAKLKGAAKQNSKEAIKETARQFESVFIQMALKSMRSTTGKAGLMENNQTKLYRDMYDQQLALELGKTSKLGFGKMLERQLGGSPDDQKLTGKTLADYRREALPAVDRERASVARDVAGMVERMAAGAGTKVMAGAKAGRSGAFSSPQEFVDELWPHAQQVGEELGVDPKMILAQAALESGWGKAVMRAADGSHSHNLFGIKADRNWEGRSIATSTLEYENGAPVRTRAAFRAYDSYADSFRDYVQFLKANPRYTQALRNAENPERYIAGLQKAGYATDPHYARKVMSIYRGNAAFEGLDQA